MTSRPLAAAVVVALGVAVLLAVAVKTVIDAEKNRVAARSASRGRGGQSGTRPLPPRPVPRPDTPIGSLARGGRLDSPPADRRGPLSPPDDDDTAAARHRLFDLHGMGQ